jgi:hypothetical protein
MGETHIDLPDWFMGERERVPSQSMGPNYHGEYSSYFPLDLFFCTTLFFPLVEILRSCLPPFPLAHFLWHCCLLMSTYKKKIAVCL